MSFPEKDPGSNPIHVGVMYANTYPVAMASLGYQTILRMTGTYPGVVAHRILLEGSDGRKYPKKTLEEGLEIRSLDAIFISCSFELDYLHLVRMLNEAGIPVLRKDRKALPLVVVGGVAPSANPESLAMIADIIGIGEGEVLLQEIIRKILIYHPYLQGAGFLSTREKFYEDLDTIEGVYVPALWEDDKGNFVPQDGRKIQQASVENPNDYESYTPIISPDGVYGAKNLIEVGRGCPTNCRFCLVSFIFKSGRDRSRENILKNAHRYEPEKASIGLVSSSLSDHPDVPGIISDLADEGYQVSVSSCKISSTTKQLVEALAKAQARSITYAPEHGSEKMRKIIGKLYLYEEVRERCEWAFDAGLRKVKMYFLTGFDEETDEDLAATPDFVRSICSDLEIGKRKGARILIGIAPLVPKAITPFQRRGMQEEKELNRKLKVVIDSFKKDPHVEIEFESPRASIVQGALSINGREITGHLVHVSRSRGNILRGWEDALKEVGTGPRESVLRGKKFGEELPWSFVKRG